MDRFNILHHSIDIISRCAYVYCHHVHFKDGSQTKKTLKCGCKSPLRAFNWEIRFDNKNAINRKNVYAIKIISETTLGIMHLTYLPLLDSAHHHPLTSLPLLSSAAFLAAEQDTHSSSSHQNYSHQKEKCVYVDKKTMWWKTIDERVNSQITLTSKMNK